MNSWDRLMDGLGRGKLPHAMLFLGPDPASRLEAARRLCQAIFCPSRSDKGPCGACVSCAKMEKGFHPDYTVVAPQGDSAGVKIEDIRLGVFARIGYKPLEAPAKAFVIDRAESLNEVTQNALLKTLEEPAANTYLILSAPSAEGLLPTLRSRLQNYHFGGSEALPDEEAARFESQAMDYVSKLLASGVDGDVYAAAPDPGKTDRRTLVSALDLVVADFREALLAKAGAPELARSSSRERYVRDLTRRLDEEGLADAIELAATAKERLVSNVQPRLALAEFWEGMGRLAGPLPAGRQAHT